MKTIRMGYLAISLFAAGVWLAQTTYAANCQPYRMQSSTQSPSHVVRIHCDAEPAKHRVYARQYASRTVKTHKIQYAENNCPCGAAYTGCQCAPDPWYPFERSDRLCTHTYMPGHWVDNTYQEYYIEPSVINRTYSADDPDVAYDPNDDQCVNRF